MLNNPQSGRAEGQSRSGGSGGVGGVAIGTDGLGEALRDGGAADHDLYLAIHVALDTGEILSYNASGYLMNHHQRSLQAPSVPAEKARESVSSRLEIQKEPSLALIPTPGLDEVLCWEFVCKGEDGEDILVYINGETGMEERIYELIESDNGILAL